MDTKDILSALLENPEAMAALGLSAVGVREKFLDIGASANTMGKQLDQVTSQIKNSSSALQALFKTTGIDINTSGFQKIGTLIDGTLGNLSRASDNALRLQSAYLSLAGSTGNLDSVFQSAGANLKDMNNIIDNQIDYLLKSSEATGESVDDTKKYYQEIGKIPGALAGVVSSGGDANNKVNLLTASMKLAHGTGRETSDVIRDLGSIYDKLGLSGEPALNFTAKFSEISNKFGVQLDSVKKGLLDVTEAYRGYVDVGESAARLTEGSAKIMNEYMGALKSTGLSGEQAAQASNYFTSQISKMTEAQKAFLSAQSGGPGGLQGAFKIDMMLREGKVEDIESMISSQMSKRFSKFVSQKEAVESPEAAAELRRQMAFIRQGPFGSLVKDDTSAIRMIEAFKAKSEGAIPKETALDPEILQKSMDRGTVVESQSVTLLTDIRNILQGAELLGSAKALDKLKQYSEAATPENADQAIIRDALALNRKKAEIEGGRSAEGMANIYKGEKAPNFFNENISNLADKVKNLLPKEGSVTRSYFNQAVQDFSDILPESIKKDLGGYLSGLGEDFSVKKSNNEQQDLKTKQPTLNPLATRLIPIKAATEDSIKSAEKPGANFAGVLAKINERKPLEQTRQQPVLNAKLNVELNTTCTICGHKLENEHNHSVTAAAVNPGTSL